MGDDRQAPHPPRRQDRAITIGCAIPVILILLALWVFFAVGVFDQIFRFIQGM